MSLDVPDFSGVRILVGGDVMLDEYWFGDASRISPEAPVPVVRATTMEQRPGGAANVALNVAALGAQASFVGVVGDDERGRQLASGLEKSGVASRLVVSRTAPTIHKLRVLARNQQLIRVDAEQRHEDSAEAFDAAFTSQLSGQDVIVLSDYGKGTLARVQQLIAACRAENCPVLVDPKGSDFSKYRSATGLTPNQSEFEAVVGPWVDEQDFSEKATKLCAQLDLGFLLITRGERGMTLVPRAAEPIHLTADAREVFDVTGAGDTVIALVAAALGAGIALADAVALANLGAGLVIRKIGVATVSPSELRMALHRRGYGGRGLVTIDELEPLVEAAKARGDKIVMTNGCFDILHAGHVAYLEEAKSLGDQLIVAINDDDSVARLKGSDRPITTLADRMSVLAGLAAVDWVVPFAEDTPANTIGRLLPDVLVKGGDWQVDQIAGADVVLANGGDVRALDFKVGRSTTALIDAIRAGN